ncbi:hypothetical protein EVAR_50538_1 [Eumeta japonica]|uniref:Uncharacterized protein n=1 Tax=Eumeta variegata TaxID=151549 RepID=A0A4C1YRZ1_EUMVA|nr:hypothetical protein EVAR_50538_1 [Eumeta japonica]
MDEPNVTGHGRSQERTSLLVTEYRKRISGPTFVRPQDSCRLIHRPTGAGAADYCRRVFISGVSWKMLILKYESQYSVLARALPDSSNRNCFVIRSAAVLVSLLLRKYDTAGRVGMSFSCWLTCPSSAQCATPRVVTGRRRRVVVTCGGDDG